LTARFRGLAHGFLGLLFRANEKHVTALAREGGQEIARLVKLSDAFAEVNDVNAVAGIKDERLHLRVPTFGLVSEMDASFEKFF
jgi:hypothetical protein